MKELADYDLTSRKTAIVALPCQIAALKKKFGDDEHILYVDLVCHGVMNAVYFQEYLAIPPDDDGNKRSPACF